MDEDLEQVQHAINVSPEDSEDPEENRPLISKSKPKKKKFKICTWSYVFFILQGFGTLLTWNSVINCPDFFLTLYSDYNTWAISVISGFFMLLNLGGLFIMTFFLGSIVSFGLKTTIMYLIMFIPLIFIGPVFGYIGGNQLVKLIITIALASICGLLQSVLQNGVFGRAGAYSGMDVQGVMLGQGIVGIVMSILRIATKAAFEDGTLDGFRRSVMVYFLFAVVGNLLCLLSVFVFAYFDIKRQEGIDREKGDDKKLKYYVENSLLKRYALYFWFEKSERGFVERIREFFIKGMKNLKLNWARYFNTFFVFAVSLSIFPGVSSILPTSTFENTSFKNGWMAVVMSSLFTTFDFFGRSIARLETKINIYFVTILAVLRIGFLVMFIFLVNPPQIFQNDFIPFILMAGMAFSNGFITTRLSVEVVERTIESEDLGPDYAQNSSEVQTFAIVAGVFFGALLSIGWGFLGTSIHIK